MVVSTALLVVVPSTCLAVGLFAVTAPVLTTATLLVAVVVVVVGGGVVVVVTIVVATIATTVGQVKKRRPSQRSCWLVFPELLIR